MTTEITAPSDVTEVASLLIPLNEKQLVLPNVTVAEIIPYRQPKSLGENTPWLLGQLEWRNTFVPVLSYEMLNSGGMPPIGSDARLAVLNGSGNSRQLPFYAILIQGIPSLLHVTEQDVVEVEAMHSAEYDQCAVSLFGEQAMIPDLDRIEHELLRFIG